MQVIALIVAALVAGVLILLQRGSKRDSREPPLVSGPVPVIGHVIGLMRRSFNYYVDLRYPTCPRGGRTRLLTPVKSPSGAADIYPTAAGPEDVHCYLARAHTGHTEAAQNPFLPADSSQIHLENLWCQPRDPRHSR